MPTILEDECEDAWFEQFPARPVERAFERSYYRVQQPNGSFVYCYEIRWADGSSRKLYGHPSSLKLLAGGATASSFE